MELCSSSCGSGKRTRSHYLSSTCLQDAIKTNIHFQSFPSGTFLTSQRRTCGISSSCLLRRISKCVEMLFTGLWPKVLSPEATWSHVCEHCSDRARLCLTLSVGCTHVALTDLISHSLMDLPVMHGFRRGESLSVPLWETLLLWLNLGSGTTLSGSEALRMKSRKSQRSAPKPSEKVPSRVIMVN